MNAGPLVVEGQVNTPQSAVVSGVTVHSLTGNISKATLFDYNPTIDETEIFFSKDGANGFEIVGVNANGLGQPRSVVANMPGSAFFLEVDPTGKYIYYTRSNNLQRTDVRDGTSNTIVAGINSFTFNKSGSKICYTKIGTDEVWAANANGSGQALVAHVSTTARVVGFQSDTTIALFNGTFFQTLDLTTGNLGTTNSFQGLTIFWVAFSSSERAIYVYAQNGANFFVFRQDIPAFGHSWNTTVISKSTSRFTFNNAVAGPEQHFAGRNEGDMRVVRVNSSFQTEVAFPFDEFPFSIAWAPNRTSLPLAGAGSSFTSGIGALFCTEMGQRTPSLVAADAVTRSSIAVTSLNDTPNGNPLYRIDCDNLKSLAFASCNGYVWKKVVDGASGLKGAVVSFDGNTGLVANIITFTKKPVITRQGKGWIVEGDLTDAVSGTGSRRPAGSAVHLD